MVVVDVEVVVVVGAAVVVVVVGAAVVVVVVELTTEVSLQAVNVVAPAAGGAPNGSHVAATANVTLVFPVSKVAGATATAAPPPSTFNSLLTQLVAAGTLVT